ncbi:hypothetical protein N7520_005500 [Penicillium odoratum]|uniref:uncharacterized protein n=1 Tax=Penicillium odoratum TaxID=1167516 RepID=UPI002547FA44|nr:uncharacterized protein N7520_005500 [Penicillium odoratum]KAJ5765941.1 hypothetical protein N7520_005500 [Penicillium odoratum]
MVVVAVAGGSGDVGRTIIEELKRATRFKIVLLTTQKDLQLHGDISSIFVNYNDVASITRQLEEHAVHTIISTISMSSDESSRSQVNLIRAAETSTSTKRFIPSEYAYINTPELLELDPTTQWWLDAVECLKKTNLQYTRFATGFFMDYWGMPYIKTNLAPFTFGIDVLNYQASIPGDGNCLLSLTYSVDLARFVVKTLDLDEWPEYSIGVGEDISFNSMLKLAEEIRGKRFQVSYDSVEKLRAGQITMLSIPKDAPYSAQEVMEYNALFGQLAIREVFHVPTGNRLNEKMSDLKPLTFEKFLKSAWEGR